MPLCVQSAFVADAYGVAVVALAMCAGLFQRPSDVDFPVARDVEVVTDVAEPPVADVVVAAGLKIQAPPFGSGGAMDDDERDGSHVSGYVFTGCRL